jgi:aryl-alcohol dehydrogenase-like predicted oxidoreductase
VPTGYGEGSRPHAESHLRTLARAALEAGANFFDRAAIYGPGLCASLFTDALRLGRPGRHRRDEVIIPSKFGIPGRPYDLSKAHILAAVDGSLRRLRTDYLHGSCRTGLTP